MYKDDSIQRKILTINAKKQLAYALTPSQHHFCNVSQFEIFIDLILSTFELNPT